MSDELAGKEALELRPTCKVFINIKWHASRSDFERDSFEGRVGRSWRRSDTPESSGPVMASCTV